LLTAIRSAAIWFGLILVTIVLSLSLFPLLLVTLPFDRRRRVGHWIATVWARTVRLLHPAWGIERHGFEHARGRGPFVIVANHESTMDILALYQLPVGFKWISKAANFHLPFLGWYMRGAGYIALRRTSKSSIVDTMKRAAKWLRAGVSVAFFPEGTRSKDGALQPFKHGAFKLAIEEHVPVLPVTLVGTRKVMAKGDWRIPARVQSQIVVDEPITTDTYEPGDEARLADDVRKIIADRRASCSQPEA
jgi:1-acyl-sn-glycerol-3-phosphate acyltransferase